MAGARVSSENRLNRSRPRSRRETYSIVRPDVRAFVQSLSPEETQLIVLRDELYFGSWAEMRHDLEDRRAGKPFIFKLIHRIEEDLARIDRLSAFEASHGVNLSEYLPAPPA